MLLIDNSAHDLYLLKMHLIQLKFDVQFNEKCYEKCWTPIKKCKLTSKLFNNIYQD